MNAIALAQLAALAMGSMVASAQDRNYHFQAPAPFRANGIEFAAGAYQLSYQTGTLNRFLIADGQGRRIAALSFPATEMLEGNGAPLLRMHCANHHCEMISLSLPEKGLRFLAWKSKKPELQQVEVALRLREGPVRGD